MAAESIGMSQKKKDRAATIGMIIFFSILAILTVLPIYLLVLASFKPGNFLLQYGLNLNLDIPHLTLDNYKLLFTGKHDYWTWFGNSLILTVITVILTLAISAFVAYGFAAYDFKGKNFLFIIVLLILSVLEFLVYYSAPSVQADFKLGHDGQLCISSTSVFGTCIHDLLLPAVSIGTAKVADRGRTYRRRNRVWYLL